MKLPLALIALALPLSVTAAACDSDGGDRRVIQIVQTNDSCTPETVQVATGEKVRFEVRNDGSKDKEVEGIEGMKLEELLVPAGRTRNLNYTAPDQAGTEKLKCYIPGGASTIIEVQVS
ncbi:MAG TPA: cupredoxin domain-containing protein [Tepidiformaceae bacterium]|nr:cupredoxin domain-containing protein [Tepidiformaceae bacterium]